MIYDCFRFLNENDMLEIRFRQHSFADKFVIIESSQTTSGLPKPYNFDAARFSEYKDKIIYLQIGNIDARKEEYEYFENNIERWNRELVHHGALKQILPILTDRDIIIWSDVDEMLKAPPTRGNFRYTSSLYYYYFNNRLYDKKTGLFLPWKYQVSFTKKILSEYNPFHLRNSNTIKWNVIDDAGWHFAYIGDVDKLKYKLEAAAHQEYNTDQVKRELSDKIKQGVDFASDRYPGKRSPIEEMPQYIIDNRDKYQKYILVEPENTKERRSKELRNLRATNRAEAKRIQEECRLEALRNLHAAKRAEAQRIENERRAKEAEAHKRMRRRGVPIEQPQPTPVSNAYDEFNILMLGSLGDAICGSVVVNNLRLAYPDSKISWCIAKKYLKISSNLTGINEWIVADDIVGHDIHEIDREQPAFKEIFKNKSNLIVLRDCSNPIYGSNWTNTGANLMETAIRDLSRFVSVPIKEHKGTFTIFRDDIIKWRNWVNDSDKYIFWEFTPISTTPLMMPEEYFALADKLYKDLKQKSIFSCSPENLSKYQSYNSDHIRVCDLSLAQVAQGGKEQGSIFIGCTSAQTWAVCETSNTPILEILHPAVVKKLKGITVKQSHYTNPSESINVKSYEAIRNAITSLQR
jgi:beta-1,4-mannosyl-glycoprotein beta-1,4-N-acetylglucosaminyltransferase